MELPSVLPPLPPRPPNFAQNPSELLESRGIPVVVEAVLPDLRVSITTAIGLMPIYFDAAPICMVGTYGEF